MTRKIRKYLYYYVLQGQYGQGWEDLTAADTWREIRWNRLDYRVNDPTTPLRIVNRREPNPEYHAIDSDYQQELRS